MKEPHYLLTPSASLILPTPIASAENTSQNDMSSVTRSLTESQEKTSKKEPAPTQKVAAATDIDANVA